MRVIYNLVKRHEYVRLIISVPLVHVIRTVYNTKILNKVFTHTDYGAIVH